MVFSSLNRVAIPFLAGRLIDEVTKQHNQTSLNNSLLAIFCIAIISTAFSFVRNYSFSVLEENFLLRLRRDVYASFLSKDVEFFDDHKSGDLLSRISADCALLPGACSDNLSQIVTSVLQLLGSLFALAYISISLTFWTFLTVPPLVIAVVLLGKRKKQLSRAYQDQIALGNSIAGEVFGNVRVVKSFANEKKECTRH